MSGRKIAALIAGLGVLLAAGVWWRTNQAITLSQQQIGLETQIRFTLNPWIRTNSSGYEPVSAAYALLDTRKVAYTSSATA